MEPDRDEQHNELSQQEKEGIGYVGLTIVGILGCLLIFLVIGLVVL